MTAGDRTFRSLCWALIVVAIGSAVLNATTAVNPFSTDIPETIDFVDRLLTYRGWDQQLYPLALVANVMTIFVFVLAALIGVGLRSLAPAGLASDWMASIFVTGAIVGIVSQLVNIGVNQAATYSYCDCGYRAYEVIAQDYALSLGWNIQIWMNVAALAILGAGLAVAGRIVEVSRDWSIVSYLIVIGLAIGVILQLAGQGQTATIVVGVTAGFGVPIWAFLLVRRLGDTRAADATATT